ncbi:hypothetical protein DES53_11535 [Roseimicrobium gellanilyticum]|uniref:Alpha/beta hydrolase n=1 Tax=Roseimicrobium gellanilyticum TaxID=748857 RepID=A0A366H4F3_9BACT|nr:hypothetical protein [Roseimicrobium gellanilyticum]RBP36894.1 hypothetical protein DES53_11535 [Roseimicrobium gellanilyticum]
MRLIYIHGINNEGKNAKVIEEAWSGALKAAWGAGAVDWSKIEVRTAYYGDTLATATDSWDGNSDAVSPMGPASPDEDIAPDELFALYKDVQKRFEISDDKVLEEIALTEGVNRDVVVTTMAKGPHKKWLKAIVRVIEKNFPGAGQKLANKFLKQAGAYLAKPGLFDEINTMVKGQVFDPFKDLSRTVVVTHSLGTIVGYVLLRKMRLEEKLPLFVTLGSPLGIGTVQKRIQGPFLKPTVATHWLNGSDPEDFVALRSELTAATFGSAEIENVSKLDNGYENAHSITQYLSHQEIAGPILKALK